MSCTIPQDSNNAGFTLTELIVAIAILGILALIAFPAFSSWVPEYQLKRAVRDLYSTMQLARMMSIKNNDKYKVIFDTSGDGSFGIYRPDGTIEKSISLMEYDKSGGVGFGGGMATKGATASGGPMPDDGVSYQYNSISFTPRGLGSGMGYAYLENSRGTAYAVGTWITGIIVLKKWNGSTGTWE